MDPSLHFIDCIKDTVEPEFVHQDLCNWSALEKDLSMGYTQGYRKNPNF